MFHRDFKGSPTETTRIFTGASAASKCGRFDAPPVAKVDRMKTDAVGWPAGNLRHRAEARPSGRPCSAYWSSGVAWVRQVLPRNDNNPLGRGGEPLRRTNRSAPFRNLRRSFEGVLSYKAQEEVVMSTSKKPLKPGDFPVIAEGQKIKKQDGKPIANTEDPDLAADVAERLNDDEARREEDKWSA